MTDSRVSREAMLRWKSIRLGEKLSELRHECDATEDRTPRSNGRGVDRRDDESETGEPNWKCWAEEARRSVPSMEVPLSCLTVPAKPLLRMPPFAGMFPPRSMWFRGRISITFCYI